MPDQLSTSISQPTDELKKRKRVIDYPRAYQTLISSFVRVKVEQALKNQSEVKKERNHGSS